MQSSVSVNERESSIVSSILSHVKEECNTCDLQDKDITDREITLQCGSNPISATFRALLLGDPRENELIITNIEKWVEEEGVIAIGDLTAKLNSQCHVVIDSFGDEFCTPPPITESSKNESDNTAGIVIPIIVIIAIVLVAIVVLLVAILLFRRRQNQKSDPYLNFDEQETSGTARLSQTLYESRESREQDNPVYGEQEDDIVKTDLEREYLEDPSILK